MASAVGEAHVVASAAALRAAALTAQATADPRGAAAKAVVADRSALDRQDLVPEVSVPDSAPAARSAKAVTDRSAVLAASADPEVPLVVAVAVDEPAVATYATRSSRFSPKNHRTATA